MHTFAFLVVRILLIGILCFIQGIAAQNLDSTRDGVGRGRTGIFFKRYMDMRNAGASRRYHREEREAERLTFPFESDGYQLVFRDDFDSLNLKTWQRGQPWGRFHVQQPHQYYGDSEMYTNKGILYLENRYAPATFKEGDSTYDIPYGTGLLNSYHSHNFRFGYFAIRCKNPRGAATWPAFWLTGKYNWPPEIDIFEMYGKCDGKNVHEQTMTLHFGKIETHTKTSLTKSVRLTEDTDTQFHIYSCLWQPDEISFFTDGIPIITMKLNRWMRQFYQEPMYMVVNNAVDHRYLQCIDRRKLPCSLQVDWIQVYQQK
ncbi:MAG: glycoside hydrolase family 16 protein [Bacteroidetes bacterium]|nr:glycoside hydrolase family 16 protein [Bacteroidota bacterium]